MGLSTTWTEGAASLPHSRQFEIGTGRDRASVLIRRMENDEGPAMVVRELWVPGESSPRDFLTDTEFVEAIRAADLPPIEGMETIRRSVAATIRALN